MVVMVLAVALSPSGLLPSDRFRPTARSPPSPSAPSPAALSGPALPPPPALPGALPGALRGGVSSSNDPLHPLFPFFSFLLVRRSLLLLLRRRRRHLPQEEAPVAAAARTMRAARATGQAGQPQLVQYFYAGDLDAVGAGDPTETLAFLAAIQENETVNAGNALACTAAACAAQAAVNLVSDGPRGPRPVSIRKKWVM